MSIRKFRQSDRSSIEGIIRATGFFAEMEIAVALELLDLAIQKPDQTDYEIYVSENVEGLVGYICYGPTPCTQGTYDLYWIAVSPAAQGKGVGAQLVDFMEVNLSACQARKVVIETSSQPLYDGTCAFYVKRGYHEAARLKEFYRPGDDKVIFMKDL